MPPGTLRRVLLLLATSGCLFLASWARLIPPKLTLEVGDIATQTIRAPRGGQYVDEDQMDKLREKAADTVGDIYDVAPDAAQSALNTLDDIFADFAEVRADPALTTDAERINALRSQMAIWLSVETLELAVQTKTADAVLVRIRDSIAGLIRREMSKEIRDNTTDLRQARESLADAAKELGLTSRFTSMVAEIGKAVLKANRIYNAQQTMRAREEARAAVKNESYPIKAGEVLIRPGEEVRRGHIAAFQAVGLMQTKVDYYQAVGLLLTFTVLTLLYGVFAASFSRAAYDRFTHLTTIAGLLVLVAFAYRTIEPTSWFEPGAVTLGVAVSMLIALMADAPLGLATGVFLGLLLPIIASGSDARLAMIGICCNLMAVFCVSRRGNKSSIIGTAAPITAAFNATMMMVGAELFSAGVDVRSVVIAFIGGLGAPLLAMGASVVLERLLGITTDFRLMELGNPTEPILQRLLAEAPGSYQSSVMVGNLAEPAAEAIGANTLLVRTAAMYHDIGKVRRPYFFVENQFGGDNPHDRLSPHLSALIITSHVKDGLELAEEHRLPAEIKDFIAQHHGTTLVKYFHSRALDQAEDPKSVQEAGFRYPGPRPQTRETALLMLADTVEAAARTLEKPSHAAIVEIVDRLVGEKVTEGQLDESPLSFRDLATVKRSFVATISGMFHQRIKYPDQLMREAESGAAHGTLSTPRPPPGGDGDGSGPVDAATARGTVRTDSDRPGAGQ